MPQRAVTTLTASADTQMLPRRWSGVIGIEGQLTGDGRMIETNALEWSVPAPFRYVVEDVGAHDGAQVAGTIETTERRKCGKIWATGTFDLEGRAGREAARQVLEERTVGVSMDLDSVAFEVRIAGELAEMYEEFFGPVDSEALPEESEEPELEKDDEGRIIVARVNPDDEVQVTTSARIRAATLVAIPAFADAKISADMDSLEDPDATSGVGDGEDDESGLTAGAAPQPLPRAEWFADPRLTAPTALTVTEDGQVFGHLALWGTCHIAHSGAGECVTPPRSAAGYSYFHTGVVRVQGGAEIPVGHITLDTGHASANASPALALAHYENTGAVVADVCVGEDRHGIWVSGSVRDLSAEQLRSLRSAPLSGDWRRIGGQLELVAALAVNVPGFPVPRTAGLVASGEMMSLVAAGMVARRQLPAATVAGLDPEDLKYLKSLITRERAAEQRKTLSAELAGPAQACALRVRGSALALRARRSLTTAGRS